MAFINKCQICENCTTDGSGEFNFDERIIVRFEKHFTADLYSFRKNQTSKMESFRFSRS